MSDTDQHSGRRTPDEAARGGSARYGKAAGPHGSGHQESRKPERKETDRGFVSRQGGSQAVEERKRGQER